MFKHILAAVDGSPCTEQVLPAAIEVATEFESEILVLHVSEHDKGRAFVYSLETPADATTLVAEAVQTARRAGVAARGQVRGVAAGQVASAIVDVARANGIDLIVMGSRGLSDMKGLMLGSVTHKVMQVASIPVLVVRPAPKKEFAANGGAKPLALQ